MASKKEAVIRFRAETAELTKGLSNINRSLSDLKSDLKLANTELKANGTSAEGLGKKYEILQEAMKENADKIQLLQKKLEACKESLGENSEEYSRLYRQLNKAKGEQAGFQSELNQTERALDDLGDEASDTVKDLKKLDDSMDDLDGGATGLQGVLQGLGGDFDTSALSAVGLGTALGNLASEAISACIEAVKEFAKYLWELPEATREFRTNMAKLTGATQQYGYETDYVNEKIKTLYGYFGDDQVATNAITNLMGIGLEEKELSETTDACIAVWTAYGDSIPIESLTESVNETAQVSKVTGVLADALNWAGISEDDFNKKLEKCKTTQKRAKLITDTLNGAYGQSKEVYDQNTESLRALVEEEYDTMDAQSQLAEKIEPYKTAWNDLKNELLKGLVPAFEKVESWVKKAKEGFEEFTKTPTWEVLKGLAELILVPIANHFINLWKAIQFVIDVFGLLWNVIQPVWDLLMEGIDYILDLVNGWIDLEDTTSETWENIKGTVEEGTQFVGKIIQDKIDEGKKKWEEGWKKIQKITEACLDVIEGILQFFNPDWKISDPKTDSAEKTNSSMLERVNKLLRAFNPNWKISKPNTTGAEGQNTSMLGRIKSALFAFKPSWRITKPNTSAATNTSWLSTISSKLRSFKPSWSIPKPKLPKISVSTSTKSIGGISIPLPSFKVSWNKLGGIFKKPTIFSTPNGLQGVGEAGAEAILPLNSFYKHLDNKLDELQTGNTININLNDVHLHDDLDINELTEQIAFNMRRKLKF